MKKIFTSLSLILAANFSFAQVGAVAPDFTVTDINGTSHTLYSYLNAGKVVLLDVSATWCGPCWNFHNAHYLEDLYAEYGPSGSNEVVVLFYEGDAATNANDLNGTGSNTQGDWVTGTPYPIMNETPLQLNLNIYAPLGFPTINVICPSDKKIKWDLWDSQAGNTAQSLQNMKDKIDEVIDECAMSASVSDASLIETSINPNPTKDNTTVNFSVAQNENVTIEIYSVSGAKLATTTFQANTGSNAATLNLTGYQAGTYFVKVASSNSTSKMIPVIKH